jgi:UDP-arabinose 4-epimerase
MKRVLVVGGAGYIGSHTSKALAEAGWQPIVFDNLGQGHRSNVKWGPLVVGDILDRLALNDALEQYRPDAVVHFAALAYVAESVTNPASYYRNNVVGTLELLDAMKDAGVRRLIFSSSCATYGVPKTVPISEDTPRRPINPYGRSKLMIEEILADYGNAYGLSYVALRYFNACGADPAGELSERHDPETHLIPRALMAAAGRISALDVFGDDYPTPDGTCIRDYIHVSDLARGHVQALRFLEANPGIHTFNLGTGVGLSIRQVLSGIERNLGRPVPVIMRPRRPGDPPSLVADPTAARKALGFEPVLSDIDTIVRTASGNFT